MYGVATQHSDRRNDFVRPTEDEWLWGWDDTPGIVSVWAEADGPPSSGAGFAKRAARARGTPLPAVAPARPSRRPPAPRRGAGAGGQHRPARDLPRARRPRRAALPRARRRCAAAGAAVLHGASRRLGQPVDHLRELGRECVLALPPEEQYLVATGRTYFRDLSFDDLHRLQFDLETTGLDAERDRIFMIAVRDPSGADRRCSRRAETLRPTRPS